MAFLVMKHFKIVEHFSFGQVVKLSCVKARTLDHWAATGFLPPSIRKAKGTGTKRVYAFSDVVAARVVSDLRAAGASLQGLRKVVRELRKMDFTSPLAEARLIVSGKDVYLKDNQELISVLRNPGQAHFPFTVLDLEATVKILRSQAETTAAAEKRLLRGSLNVRSG
jgi:DNA-binding transcriptional MerR regulator